MLTPQTTMNMPGPATAALLELSKEYFVMNDDDVSTTSSTMSDDVSLSDESDLSDEDDMDISMLHHSIRSNESAENLRRAAPRPSRSTVSLSAMVPSQTSRLPARVPQGIQTKHISMASMKAATKPAPMTAMQTVSAQACSPGDITPNDYLCKLLETKLDRVPFHSLGDYFLKTEPQHIRAWDGDLLRAIRTQNLELVQEMHQGGKPLQACNRFGESILHVCVRRGTPEILAYLLREGEVSPRVHCENGRTPLHDALWTFTGDESSIKMTALLLKQCPEMLLITDKRGFTPLDYVPRSQWENCYKFLERCLPLLVKLKNNGRSSA